MLRRRILLLTVLLLPAICAVASAATTYSDPRGDLKGSRA